MSDESKLTGPEAIRILNDSGVSGLLNHLGVSADQFSSIADDFEAVHDGDATVEDIYENHDLGEDVFSAVIMVIAKGEYGYEIEMGDPDE